LSLLHRLYAASWGPRTQDILHASLMTMAGHDEATLVDLPLLLTRPDYRRRFVAPIDDPLGVGGFWNWYEALSPAEQAQVLGPVLNKLRTLLLRPRLRNIVGQPTSTIDLRAALDERGVVLATLAVGTLGADAAHLLGALLVGRLWQAIRSRRNRHTASVYIDEFQDVLHLPTDLADVLAQARSFGVGLTLAHQHLGQLGPDIRSAVLANARSRVVFQSGSEDARVLARVLGGGLTLEDLAGLPAFEAYAQLYAADATQPPLSLATEPLAGSGRARAHDPVTQPPAVWHAARGDRGAPAPACGGSLRPGADRAQAEAVMTVPFAVPAASRCHRQIRALTRLNAAQSGTGSLVVSDS
jgi:hypothetical protein